MSSFAHLSPLHEGGYKGPLSVIERRRSGPRLNSLHLHDTFSDLGSNFESC